MQGARGPIPSDVRFMPDDSCGCSHDFIGRSTARGAFVVWTHNMKNITYDASFVPQGASGSETFEGRSVDLRGILDFVR